MANDAEHLFVCLFAICISFLVKCLFMSVFYFESCVLVWWMVGREAWYCLVLFGSECRRRMEASDVRTVRHGWNGHACLYFHQHFFECLFPHILVNIKVIDLFFVSLSENRCAFETKHLFKGFQHLYLLFQELPVCSLCHYLKLIFSHTNNSVIHFFKRKFTSKANVLWVPSYSLTYCPQT